MFHGSILGYTWEVGGFRNALIVTDVDDSDGDEGTDWLWHFGALQFDDYTFSLEGANAPLVVPDEVSTDEDNAVVFSVDAYDFDGGTPAINPSVSVTGGGTLTLLVGSTPLSPPMGIGYSFSLEFDPGAAYQYLAVNESVTEQATVEVSDGQGNVTQQVFDIVINGLNDTPTIGSVDYVVDTVEEDGAVQQASGGITASDPDTSDTLTYSVQGGGTGTYGTLSVDPTTGDWTYILANGSAAVQALQYGETQTDTFTVEVDDGNGGVDTATLEIDVLGANETPVPDDPGALAVDEADGVFVIDLRDYVTDAEGGVLTFSDIRITRDSRLIDFQIVGDGLIGIDPSNLGFALDDGEQAQVVFSYVVQDDSGDAASDTASGVLNLTINGADNLVLPPPPNSPPTALDTSVSATEDGPMIQIALADLVSDPDAGDTATITEIRGTRFGSLTNQLINFTQIEGAILIDPSQFYMLESTPVGNDTTDAFLGDGELANLNLTFTVEDSAGASDSGVIALALTGVDNSNDNNAPVVAPLDLGTVVVDDAGTPTLEIDLSALVSDPDLGDVLTITPGELRLGGTEGRSVGYDFNAGTGVVTVTFADLGLSDGESINGSLVFTVTDGTDTTQGVVTALFDDPGAPPPPAPTSFVLDFEPFSAPDPDLAIPLPVMNTPRADVLVDSYDGFIFQGVATVIETDEIDVSRGATGVTLGQTTSGGDNVLVGGYTTSLEPVLDEFDQPVLDERGQPVFEQVVDDLFGIIAPGINQEVTAPRVVLNGQFGAPGSTLPVLQPGLATAFNLDGVSINAAISEDVSVTVRTYGVVVTETPVNASFSTYVVEIVELDSFVFDNIDASNAATVLDFNDAGFADSLGNTNTAAFDNILAATFETSDGSALVFDDFLLSL
ncbi:VCBS domain-containing protein [Ruegeria marina]|uniref:VCBS domain-containing protein n=1 Tax=Ruegeria marina TaxID=639004 RepID=UPI001FE0D1A1|nr:VCBS domain-containing protein [Ruegeria marina]